MMPASDPKAAEPAGTVVNQNRAIEQYATHTANSSDDIVLAVRSEPTHPIQAGWAKQLHQAMPAKSKKQQMAAGAALSAKRGERSKASLKGASRQMAESMSEKQLEDFASTKRKSLPTKKRQRS